MNLGAPNEDDSKDLHTLAKATKVTTGIDLCMVGFGMAGPGDNLWQIGQQLNYLLVTSDDEDGYSNVPHHVELLPTRMDGQPLSQLGDLHAMRMEEVLNCCAPYCCTAADFNGGDEYNVNVDWTEQHVILVLSTHLTLQYWVEEDQQVVETVDAAV
ncbi:hypothetical protein ONZ51_g5340 [Trametes cubensis]|uniref:Uncharacterized protein n=1 Tax=Trametes cubensis TaxID=1111947 RepID=A0AAD7TU99_9APHY|nr:hypothetical protein ONZ51_g5340 [Trametes cubensis]